MKVALKYDLSVAFLIGIFVFDLLDMNPAYAALPWEGPIETLKESLTGTVAKAICAIVVCVAGLMMALGEGGQFGRMVGRLVFGLALAIGFMQIISMF